jgi:hypothetical protein
MGEFYDLLEFDIRHGAVLLAVPRNEPLNVSL